jgi:hypothetical protein
LGRDPVGVRAMDGPHPSFPLWPPEAFFSSYTPMML